jgi:hypothetical protein
MFGCVVSEWILRCDFCSIHKIVNEKLRNVPQSFVDYKS